MGFGNGSYAKVWQKEIDDKGRCKVRISTNGKDVEGNTRQDFGYWCFMYGKAKEKYDGVNENDIIILDGTSTENVYDKNKKIHIWTCKIFDFQKYEKKTE